MQTMGRLIAICLAAFILTGARRGPSTTLINGTEVNPADWKQVVLAKIPSAQGTKECTATVVGPKVILMAAHCAGEGSVANFSIDGKAFSATMTQSPQFAIEHDLALGVTADTINVAPFSIGGTPSVGQQVTLMGYGCTTADASPSDGKLRQGVSVVSEVKTARFASATANGALLCPGDSGGPAYIKDGSKFLVMGVNSSVKIKMDGTIIGPNYSARTDGTDQRRFFTDFATAKGVQICGINTTCGGGAQPSDPSCKMSASPATISLGGSTTIWMDSENAVSATIDGQSISVPGGSRVLTPTSAGAKTVQGSVTAANGATATCSVSYSVQGGGGTSPTCSVVAIPNSVALGGSVSLELTSTNATSATINGNPVSVPSGKQLVTAQFKGDISVTGEARDASGNSGKCYTSYKVTDGPSPDLPNFAFVATHCGPDANAASTGINRVCMGVLKKDPSITHVGFIDLVSIRYNSGNDELLPIIARRPVSGSSTREELALYNSGVVQGNNGATLKMSYANLSKDMSGTPTQVEGKSQTGQVFRASLTAQ